uniref:Lipoxygenase domain-containing protein n=1 Tax=Neogobius melanostomus TaxID=47308 RepID=A0A8C6S7A7_9GOBI
MVIFTCSAQHAAVNNGQGDYGSWMPNTPTSLQKPPPTKKGTVTEQTVLQTLPDRNTTQCAVTMVRLPDPRTLRPVALGHFPHEHFTEEVPCRLMREFRAELDKLDMEIDSRNQKTLPLPPYIYLKPTLLENSVSI